MAQTQTRDAMQQPIATSFHSFPDAVARASSDQVLPHHLVLPEAQRPGLAHDAYLPEFDLPVFDLSLLKACQTQEERSDLGARLSTVCKEFGFFQLVNHGLEPGLMKRLESFGRSFFDLPPSTKQKVQGYRGRLDTLNVGSKGWIESVNVSSAPDKFGHEFFDVVSMEGTNEFRDCFERYVDFMEAIAATIFELLMEALGAKCSTVAEGFGRGFSSLRYNYYPPCPQPSVVHGLGGHRDPNAITILYQDEVGGLQLQLKDGAWRAVKPNSDAFVVNVGDVLEVLSNGVYESAEHRAVVNSTKSRLSMPFFYGPKYTATVEPHEDLVDAYHPPQFKPFTYGEYVRYRISTPPGRLHAFAGINN